MFCVQFVVNLFLFVFVSFVCLRLSFGSSFAHLFLPESAEMLLIFAFFVALVDAQPATFVLHFGCSFPNNGTHIIGTSVSVCGALPTYIQTVAPVGSCMIGQEFLVYLNTSSLIGLSDCSVVVSENQVSVSRAFQILPGETYEWMDLTADLTINIEDWNPWCAVSPDTDPTASFNGGRVTLLGGNTVFRGYSPFRAMCTFLSDLRWDLFPHLANGYAFGDTLNPDLCTSAGSFHRPVVVGVLRTTDPITVVVHEFKFTGPNPDPCLDSRVFTIGKSAIGFPTSDISGGFVQYSQDTNCGDGSCDSGLLISRLQVESRCWDPSDPIIGIPQGAQNAYNETLPDGSVAGRSFPTGALLINWDHPDGSQRNYRFESIAAESNSVYFIIAADNYQIYTQYDTVPNSSPLAYKSYNSSVDYNSAVSARFIKQPTANCGYGSCEAKPITSTLHIDTQGLCDEMESVSIYQPQFNGNGVSFAVQNYHPNCMQLFANSKLLFCVWNLNPTQVVVNYKTLGSAQLPMINCQTTSQRCDVTASLPPFCASQSDGTPCNDENNCTLNDTCLGGVCVGSNPIVCSFPVDQCHYVGVCNPSTGLCVASAKPDGDQCNDDNVCTDSDSCQNGVCVGTPAPGRACQQSSVAGSCVTGSTCSSGGVCGGGSFHPFGTPCDDTDLCSNSDQCSSSGVCSGTPATCVNCLPPYKYGVFQRIGFLLIWGFFFVYSKGALVVNVFVLQILGYSIEFDFRVLRRIILHFKAKCSDVLIMEVDPVQLEDSLQSLGMVLSLRQMYGNDFFLFLFF